MILRQRSDSIAVLTGNYVTKTVFGTVKSGFRKVSPEEAVAREVRALTILKDVEGIQKLVSQDSPRSITSKDSGRNSLGEHQGYLPASYFQELEIITKECQKRGVYRIGQGRHDFLIKNDKPIIIDFGNILFYDDPIFGLPLAIAAIKIYSSLRIRDLNHRYTQTQKGQPAIEQHSTLQETF